MNEIAARLPVLAAFATRRAAWTGLGTVAYVTAPDARTPEPALAHELRALEGTGLALRRFGLDTLGAARAAAHARVARRRPWRYVQALADAARTPAAPAVPHAFRAAVALADALQQAGDVGHLHARSGAGAALVTRLASRLTGIPFSVAADDGPLAAPAVLALRERFLDHLLRRRRAASTIPSKKARGTPCAPLEPSHG